MSIPHRQQLSRAPSNENVTTPYLKAPTLSPISKDSSFANLVTVPVERAAGREALNVPSVLQTFIYTAHRAGQLARPAQR